MSDPQPHVDREHPWPALLSFREDDQSFFGGREEEVEALYRRIASGRLTLLFGLSGLGKTSLLRAGLFPRLRREHYFPVYIRLSYGRDLPPPVEQIKREIAEQAKASRVDAPEPRTGETLWEYFHRPDADFWDERNYPSTPVLVFDQFEELFTKSREVPAAANALVEELANLAEGASPELMREASTGDRALLRQVWEDRWRMLIGIRSDYLAQLQGISDRLRAIFANRYELRRMSGAAALRSTLTAGGHLMDEQVARRVVRFVAGAAESGDDVPPVDGLEVEPALLSLVCSELNATRLARGEAKITVSMLSGTKDEILSRFYEASFADVTPELREVVEDKLVTRDGRSRNFISEQTARETPGVTDDDLAKLVHRRLLRFEESGSSRRLELTHDLLTAVAAASRATREQRRQLREAEQARDEAEKRAEAARRTVRRSRALALVFFVLLAAAIAGPFIASRRATIGAKRVEADSAFRLALQKLATEEPSEGLAYLAHVVRNDPHNQPARVLLYQQFLTRSWPVPIRTFGPQGRIDDAAFTRDGARVAFRLGQTIEVWDVARGQRIASLNAGYQPADIRFASDGWTVVLHVNDARGDVRKLTAGQPLFWNCRTNQSVSLGTAAPRVIDVPHELPVADVSADGKEMAVGVTGINGGTVRIIPVGGGAAEILDDLRLLDFGSRSIRFSPDRRFVVVDGWSTFVIWDRQQQTVLTPPRSGDFIGELSRDGGKVLISSDQNVTPILLDGATPAGPKLLHPSPPLEGAFDAAGRQIVTVAQDYGVRVWNAENGETLYDPIWHYEPVQTAVFSNDGARIFTWSTRLSRWWDAMTGKALGAPIVEPKAFAAQPTDGGSNLVIASSAARVWTLPIAVLPSAITKTRGHIVAFSPDRKVVLVNRDGTMEAFDTDSGKLLWSAPDWKTPDRATGPSDSPTDLSLMGLIDAKTGKSLGITGRGGGEVVISADRSTVATRMHTGPGEPRKIMVTSLVTAKPIGDPIEVKEGEIRFRLSRDGSRTAIASSDGEVQVWDVRAHRLLLGVRDDDGVSIDLSPDGRQLVTVSSEHGIRVWTVDGGSVRGMTQIDGAKSPVFTPDGQRLVIIAEDNLTICNAQSLECQENPLAQSDVSGYDFSADGARMVAVSANEVRVWDVATGLPLSPVLQPFHPKVINFQPEKQTMIFGITPDGSALLAMSDDGLYRLPLPAAVSDEDAERLADLAESLAGVRVRRLGATERIDGREALENLSKRCGATGGLACDLVRWIRTDERHRTISPVSPVTIHDYVENELRVDPSRAARLRALFPNEPALRSQ